MRSPSWTPLPPASPPHPSGSSQCTSPKHPVSCIQPGLAISFTHDNIHVSMLFSQVILRSIWCPVLACVPTVELVALRSSQALDSQVARRQRVCLPMQETQETPVQTLGREEPLEKEVATCSSIYAWKIPWTEEATVHGVAKSCTQLSTHAFKCGHSPRPACHARVLHVWV